MSEFEVIGVAALLLSGFITAIHTAVRKRSPRHPGVVFPIAYLILTAGTPLWKLYSGFYPVRVPEDRVPVILFVSTIAIVSFHIGILLPKGARLSTSELATYRIGHARQARLALQFVVFLALVLFIVASLAIHPNGTESKSLALAQAAGPVARVYYASAALLLLGFCALLAVELCFHKVSVASWGLILAFTARSLAIGERDAALILLGAVLIHGHRWRLKRVATVLSVVLIVIAAVPILRSSLSDHGHIRELIDESLRSLLTSGSANFLIFANVSDWVPLFEPYRFGKTYLTAILSLVPGIAIPSDDSLLHWFKMNYAPGGSAGYGFAMDAESYLNFGWIGPPIVFLLWGYWLSRLYNGALARPGDPYSAYRIALAIILSVFAIRTDFRAFVKMVTYGSLFGWTFLRLLPSCLSQLSRTTSHSQSARSARGAA